MPYYYMLNKPAGYVTACRDELHKTVLDLFPPELAGKLHPVGRLDMDTVGLLLLTDDGMADQALMLPGKHVAKRYFFYAFGELTEEKIRAVETGLVINRNKPPTLPAKIEPLEKYTVRELAEFMSPERREQYMKNPDGAAFSAVLTICEGRNHQVKLMMRQIHCKVCYLKRLSIGDITLDDGLKEGEYRELTQAEVRSIFENTPGKTE